jgi:[acyl-carrier-protein] S-malonyltransferase
MKPLSQVELLRHSLSRTAFSFRGYNVTNLGRTFELLEHPTYGPIIEKTLREASDICGKVLQKPVDLSGRIRRREETRDLSTYAEDVALIAGVELGQLRILEQYFEIPFRQARLAFGFSLGELVALVAAGVYELADMLPIPISLSADCTELAHDVTMGVLFSRKLALDVAEVQRLCREINLAGHGVIGISTILSPNCVLLLGQQDTVDRFHSNMEKRMPRGTNMRKNANRWPPLHTPITWQRHIPNRVALMLQTTRGGTVAPPLPIMSAAEPDQRYNGDNTRELLHHWVDHPQQLWEEIVQVLEGGIETIVHVGPDPNLIPATFKRLSDDVMLQLHGRFPGGFGMRVLSHVVRRPWLARRLPSEARLLRAPQIRHVILEDWLLEQGEIRPHTDDMKRVAA